MSCQKGYDFSFVQRYLHFFFLFCFPSFKSHHIMQFFPLEELVGDIIVVVNTYSLKKSFTRIAQSKRKKTQYCKVCLFYKGIVKLFVCLFIAFKKFLEWVPWSSVHQGHDSTWWLSHISKFAVILSTHHHISSRHRLLLKRTQSFWNWSYLGSFLAPLTVFA